MLAALRQSFHERFVSWALRTRPPEPVPIRLSQRRVYVLPSRAGLLYAISLAIMLIGAINYNLSLGFALVFLLAGLGISAILNTFRNLAGLQLSVGNPRPVHVGDTIGFPIVLHNPDERPRRLLRLYLPGEERVSCDVPARDAACVRLPCAAPRRGWQAMPRLTIETTWPLGLIRAWSYGAPALKCLVYPKPADTVPPAPTFDDQKEGRFAGESGDEDFAGLRRHQSGDPPHHVAWKAAARLGPEALLQTKQFAGAAARALRLDWDALPRSLATEVRLSILARWAIDADAAGLAWCLHLPGCEVPEGRGPEHLHACLKALALHGT